MQIVETGGLVDRFGRLISFAGSSPAAPVSTSLSLGEPASFATTSASAPQLETRKGGGPDTSASPRHRATRGVRFRRFCGRVSP